MFLEIHVNDSVTLIDPLGSFMCVAEQFVKELQVLQFWRLHEYVSASQHTAV